MKDKITIDGIEYTILVKFTSESTNKDYIIYSTLEPVKIIGPSLKLCLFISLYIWKIIGDLSPLILIKILLKK